MSRLSLAYSVEIESEQCITCGVIFGIPASLLVQRKRDHGKFYCPNGHNQYYPGESDVERAERLLKEEQDRHKRTLARENELVAEKTRLEKRIKAGVCPCCKRTFKQLALHMKHKHPGYAK